MANPLGAGWGGNTVYTPNSIRSTTQGPAYALGGGGGGAGSQLEGLLMAALRRKMQPKPIQTTVTQAVPEQRPDVQPEKYTYDMGPYGPVRNINPQYEMWMEKKTGQAFGPSSVQMMASPAPGSSGSKPVGEDKPTADPWGYAQGAGGKASSQASAVGDSAAERQTAYIASLGGEKSDDEEGAPSSSGR